jgi:hypothetical protein
VPIFYGSAGVFTRKDAINKTNAAGAAAFPRRTGAPEGGVCPFFQERRQSARFVMLNVLVKHLAKMVKNVCFMDSQACEKPGKAGALARFLLQKKPPETRHFPGVPCDRTPVSFCFPILNVD